MTIDRQPIHAVQGPGLRSPLAGQTVRVRGVVTGHSRKGYFVQDPDGSPDPAASAAVFVFSPRRKARVGLFLEIVGEVLDFAQDELTRPTTQLKPLEFRLLEEAGPAVDPVWLTAEILDTDAATLARRLNGLEGMLVGIAAGATFSAPSNPFGDYVCVPADVAGLRAPNGGMLVDPTAPDRWLPSFRIVDYNRAPQLNVGATLDAPVVGPLNYRASAFQIAAQGGIEFTNAPAPHDRTTFPGDATGITILTLNGFNLDAHVESAERVLNPDRDIDDDKLYGRFELLARAIVEHAGRPAIVALQEIQDNDGAELTSAVDATATYGQLCRDIRRHGGPEYAWADIPPTREADGGQPGGNIRNAYLYDPARIELEPGSMVRIGEHDPAFEGSRKPLLARFRKIGGRAVVVANVHLASKRHQHSIFAPESPGHDPRESVRIRQAEIVRDAVAAACADGTEHYITGDFNDFEFSQTLRTLCGDASVNLVDTLPANLRFDYNHRGQLQVLMHGVVSKRLLAAGGVDYEILHGNELEGVQPGSMMGKASDHAYVIAQLRL